MLSPPLLLQGLAAEALHAMLGALLAAAASEVTTLELPSGYRPSKRFMQHSTSRRLQVPIHLDICAMVHTYWPAPYIHSYYHVSERTLTYVHSPEPK